MTDPTPLHCRAEAFEALADELDAIDTTPGLLRCAVAVSMHQLDDVDPDAVEAAIDELASSVCERLTTDSVRAAIAHAHEVLFEEARFEGNSDDYYNPRNSYPSVVLKTRKGLPISLVLIYKCVLEQLGVSVMGVNAPGHFLAGVLDPGEGGTARNLMLIDPFNRGRLLTRDEAFSRIEEVAGGAVIRDDSLLRPATHRDWLIRTIQNLVGSFDRLGRRDDMAAMLEMRALVESVG